MGAPKKEPETEEEVYAHYMRYQNYSKTARKFGMPLSTVYGLVKRLAGDSLEDHRRSMRADLSRRIWKRVGRLLEQVTPENLGSEKVSVGADTARAMADIAKVATYLEPKGDDGPPPEQEPLRIVVGFVDGRTEVVSSSAAAPAQDTSLPTPKADPDPTNTGSGST